MSEEITVLQNEIKKIEQELSDPVLYHSDKERFECSSTALEKNKNTCTQKEWREFLREEMECKNRECEDCTFSQGFRVVLLHCCLSLLSL